MNALVQTLDEGGPVVATILGLAVLLYAQGFTLVLHLLTTFRRIRRDRGEGAPALRQLRTWRSELQEMFRRQRVTLSAMIAAAPLLGLLGTVTGMISTFHGMAARSGSNSMEGLAAGISEALIATKAGLSVAIPGVLLLYYAHRQLEKCYHALAVREHEIGEGR